jgi:type I restriction enzyme S subunit
LPNNWTFCSLENISKAIGDGIHGTPQFSESGEYYFVNGSNLLNGTISTKNAKKCDKTEYLKYMKPIDEATILLSINGTLGNLSFYKLEPIVLGKSAAFISLIDREMLLWVSLFLKSSIAWRHFKSKLTGTTIKNIPLSAIRSLQISIPPLQEQSRIMKKYMKSIKLIG